MTLRRIFLILAFLNLFISVLLFGLHKGFSYGLAVITYRV